MLTVSGGNDAGNGTENPNIKVCPESVPQSVPLIYKGFLPFGTDGTENLI